MVMLKINRLYVNFETQEGTVKAVDDVDLVIDGGETLGLVGETGSGKTVLGEAVCRLLPKTAGLSGEVWYQGRNLLGLSEEEMRRIRGREIAMILQNPLSSLNPALTIGEQIAEVLREHGGLKRKESWEKAGEILEQTGIPAKRAANYPHEFSGGMRQRAMIAIGLACQPSLLIADEPTKGLDVTVQLQIVELLRSVTKETSLARSMLLITHDLGVAAELTDYMAVMYAGKVIEFGKTRDILKNSRHPYTRGFMASHPANGLKAIKGFSPSLIKLPVGCSFHPRCEKARELCRQEVPPIKMKGEKHGVRCFYA